MVEAIANLSLETIRDLLVEETKFLLSVSGEVEKVKRDLKRIHAMFMKADRERSDTPILKLYIGQLKDLAFEAETVLETYWVEVESKKEGRRRSLKEKHQSFICIMCECSTDHEVGKEVQDIISRLADLTNNIELEFGKESSSTTGYQGDLLRYEYAHEVEPHCVGMEKDIELLVSRVKGKTGRRVIKIYGMGGLGKTSLARMIYNNEEVQSYARAWMCITQQFQPKVALGTILKKLDSNAAVDNMGVTELVEGIHSVVAEKKGKCLIVIDDIWEPNHWDIIKKAFPVNCNVLLTTRSENIANRESHPYQLDFLTEDQGWELLHKIALPLPLTPGQF